MKGGHIITDMLEMVCCDVKSLQKSLKSHQDLQFRKQDKLQSTLADEVELSVSPVHSHSASSSIQA